MKKEEEKIGECESFSFSYLQKIYLPFKRLFDILFSLIFIIVLSPLFIILFFVVLIDTHGFPIFRQLRIGKNNKKFLILKFRTMNVNTPKDIPTHLLENPDKYITKAGKYLRKSSLDELPQLFNIFVGHMSFIGPRPALWSQLDLIEERNKCHVEKIRPGLTGLAQCKGRDTLDIPSKVSFDKEYLHKFNLFLDIKLLFMTFLNTISEKDVIEGKQS